MNGAQKVVLECGVVSWAKYNTHTPDDHRRALPRIYVFIDFALRALNFLFFNFGINRGSMIIIGQRSLPGKATSYVPFLRIIFGHL